MQQPQEPKPQLQQEPDKTSCNPTPVPQKPVDKEALEVAKQEKALLKKTNAIVRK